MFKRPKVVLVLACCLWGMFSSVFAVDLSSWLFTQNAQDELNQTTIFNGKIRMGNVYDRNFSRVKHQELNATQAAITQIVDHYLRKSCAISANDVLHVLYDSNLGFQTFVSEIKTPGTLLEKMSASTIKKSYLRFAACDNLAVSTDYAYMSYIQSEVTSLYFDYLNNVFLLSTMDQDNFGEDILWNGSLEDSKYDILSDITTLGDTFFTTFQAPPVVLFYQLPKRSQWSSLDDTPPSAGQVTDTAGRNTAGGNSGGEGSSAVSAGTSSAVAESQGLVAANSAASTSVSRDPEVQQFVQEHALVSAQEVASLGASLSNLCSTGEIAPVAQTQISELTIDEKTYLSGLEYFIDNASIEDTINDSMAKDFLASMEQSVTSPNAAVNSIAFAASQQAFGIGSTSCETSCLALPAIKQFDCQKDCAKSCIASCADLPLKEKLLCVSDCACFMISGPNRTGWDQLQDIYRIKFCKAPLEQVYFSPKGKTVSSIQSIFQEIMNVLQGLKESGQTVKLKKTKEFLDMDISLKLSDLLDFKILVNFKSLFPQKNKTQQSKQQKIATDALNLRLLNMQTSSPEAENYNKYLVVSNPAQLKASLLPATTLAQQQDNLAETSALSPSFDRISPQDIVSYYQNQKIALLTDDVQSFLVAHTAFWDQMFDVMNSLQQEADRLHEKIKTSTSE